MNCDYCGYFTGLIAYVQEMGAGTEQHWCPFEPARRMMAVHNCYHRLMEYGDGIDYHQNHETLRRDFADLKGGSSTRHPAV